MNSTLFARKCPICGELLEPGETCYCQVARYRNPDEIPYDMENAVIMGKIFVHTSQGYIYIGNYRKEWHGPVIAYEGLLRRLDDKGEKIVEDYPIRLTPRQFWKNYKTYAVSEKYVDRSGKTRLRKIGEVRGIGHKDSIKAYWSLYYKTSPDKLSLRKM